MKKTATSAAKAAQATTEASLLTASEASEALRLLEANKEAALQEEAALPLTTEEALQALSEALPEATSEALQAALPTSRKQAEKALQAAQEAAQEALANSDKANSEASEAAQALLDNSEQEAFAPLAEKARLARKANSEASEALKAASLAKEEAEAAFAAFPVLSAQEANREAALALQAAKEARKEAFDRLLANTEAALFVSLQEEAKKAQEALTEALTEAQTTEQEALIEKHKASKEAGQGKATKEAGSPSSLALALGLTGSEAFVACVKRLASGKEALLFVSASVTSAACARGNTSLLWAEEKTGRKALQALTKGNKSPVVLCSGGEGEEAFSLLLREATEAEKSSFLGQGFSLVGRSKEEAGLFWNKRKALQKEARLAREKAEAEQAADRTKAEAALIAA